MNTVQYETFVFRTTFLHHCRLVTQRNMPLEIEQKVRNNLPFLRQASRRARLLLRRRLALIRKQPMIRVLLQQH